MNLGVIMMSSVTARLRSVALAAAASAVLAVPATAAVLDFESVSAGLYFAGESFDQNGYRMTVLGNEFGAVDTGVGTCVGLQCPNGSSGQFYFGLNDGALGLERIDGTAFTLNGFSAAFLAALASGDQVPSPGKLVIAGSTAEGSVMQQFEFGPSDSFGEFSFKTFAPEGFVDLLSVSFAACTYDDAGVCQNTNFNLSQFALDNVSVSSLSVPEPGTLPLLGIALAGLAFRMRRMNGPTPRKTR